MKCLAPNGFRRRNDGSSQMHDQQYQRSPGWPLPSFPGKSPRRWLQLVQKFLLAIGSGGVWVRLLASPPRSFSTAINRPDSFSAVFCRRIRFVGSLSRPLFFCCCSLFIGLRCLGSRCNQHALSCDGFAPRLLRQVNARFSNYRVAERSDASLRGCPLRGFSYGGQLSDCQLVLVRLLIRCARRYRREFDNRPRRQRREAGSLTLAAINPAPIWPEIFALS